MISIPSSVLLGADTLNQHQTTDQGPALRLSKHLPRGDMLAAGRDCEELVSGDVEASRPMSPCMG